MKNINGFFLGIGLFSIFLIYFVWAKKRSKEKKNLQDRKAKEREITRQKHFDFYKSRLENISEAVHYVITYFYFNIGYFTHSQINSWKKEHINLFNEIKDIPYNRIQLTTKEVKIIKLFFAFYKQSEYYRSKINDQFIIKELKDYSHIFDNIEQRKLDIQQRLAIVTDEDNNLVIAGAGTGKTTTIVGKVKYIIQKYKIGPKEILLISFTKKSASTLARRINIEGLEAKTFHKLGKDIITKEEGNQPSIFDDKQFKPLITRYFKELTNDEKYLRKVIKYFTNYLKPPKSEFEFENQGNYIQYIKDKNFRSYNLIKVSTRGKVTLRMEVVKSIQECKIANFLLFNNLIYEYEKPYEHNTATPKFSQYKPDFTITQNEKKIYIEHFGVSRNGDVPKWFAKNGESEEEAKEKYWTKIRWAREMHEFYKTTLIETFSYEMTEDVLFKNLTKKLTDAGIILKPKSTKEIWQIINNSAKDEVDNLITLFRTFITLMKSNNYTIDEILNNNKQTREDFSKKRNNIFLEIIKPIFAYYTNYLSERNEIDFSDMINKASKYIISDVNRSKFKYVIIDEFQDISIGRYQLVKAIKDNSPSCKLFCVGDDWQSIYRFSGSDITLFKEFEKYFGFTVKSKIETTYRFNNPLVDVSSSFIKKNPNQSDKILKSVTKLKKTNYKILYSNTQNQDDTLEVQKIFDNLIDANDDILNKEIFILGRYHFDIMRLKNGNNIFRIDNKKKVISYSKRNSVGENITITVPFLTVHKAKGLEADIVIVLNCNSGKYGFPSDMSDDEVLNLLLSEEEQFENSEERRLFYVAMTRAKENVFFISDSLYKSKFIMELESNDIKNKKCPFCKNADIIKRSGTMNGNPWAFYACTNYLYGCEYQEWLN